MSRRLRRPPKRSTRKVSKCTPNVLTDKQCKDYNLINYEICNITVNVEIFAQYIFSRISRRAIDARKFDVSENYNHNRTNRK